MTEQRSSTGFVHVEDGRIVDPDGQPLLLRGMGLGNWLLAEGYMWKLSPGRESAREIEALVEDLVGADAASSFWRRFRDAFITRSDIDRIAAEGMNHVRLPINWRVIMDDAGEMIPAGLARVDQLISWCRDAGLLVLLDLHGAPGGQTGTNIDDSMGRPELFMDERNEALTETLWVELARRYRDDPTVLGYDLLNEPLPDEWQHRYADELVALYKRLTAAIRAVDPHHLITYEGSHWATNWSIFDEVWDDNSVLQFHKYWSPPDRASIQRFLDVGERLGLPIYMGEGGENNLDWFATAFQLYEDLDIGWCFWPWKKIDTVTSPCSIDPPAGWQAIVDFANGRGPRPSGDAAQATLDEVIERSRLDSCTYRPEVVNALFRRAPVDLPATAFRFTGRGDAYATSAASPLPSFRAEDEVTIEVPPSGRIPAFDHDDGTDDEPLTVRLGPSEWLTYDVETVAPAGVSVTLRAPDGPVPSAPRVTLDGEELTVTVEPPGWRACTPGPVPPGRHALRVISGADGLRFSALTARTTPATSGGLSDAS